MFKNNFVFVFILSTKSNEILPTKKRLKDIRRVASSTCDYKCVCICIYTYIHIHEYLDLYT